jgi:AcrR family transcriptional regulator
MATQRTPRSSNAGADTVGAAPLSERREEILAVAAELFADRGYVGTTVRELADAAGILSGSLYHHFDSKESMLDEILGGYMRELLEEYRKTVAEQKDPVDALTALVHQAFASLGPHRAAVTVIQNDAKHLSQFPRFAYLDEVATETERLWLGVIRNGIRQGVFRDDIDPKLIYRFIRDAVWVTVRWYHEGGKYSAEEIADFYLAMALDGLCVGKGRHRTKPPQIRPSTKRTAIKSAAAKSTTAKANTAKSGKASAKRTPAKAAGG